MEFFGDDASAIVKAVFKHYAALKRTLVVAGNIDKKDGRDDTGTIKRIVVGKRMNCESSVRGQ